MSSTGFSLFDIPLGHCGIAWGPAGLTGVQLPEQDVAATRARMQRRFPQLVERTPPLAMQQLVERIVALLLGRPGKPADLSDIALDMSGVQCNESLTNARHTAGQLHDLGCQSAAVRAGPESTLGRHRLP
jgi:O6-methylguanine-DNA--protein-cysteine methyltransferase